MRRSTTRKAGVFSLKVHDSEYSNEELLLNPLNFPDVKVGDVVEIFPEDKPERKCLLRVSTMEKPKGALIVSIRKDRATVYEFANMLDVAVRKVDSLDTHMVDFVEILFKDQYVSRCDMQRFKESMLGQCLTSGQKSNFLGIKGTVKELLAQDKRVLSGLVGPKTKVVFRSRSARVFWLVQLSAEMWEFDDEGDLFFEKAVNEFVSELLGRWKALNVTHNLCVVFFSRTHYTGDNLPVDDGSLMTDGQGRKYRDYYQVHEVGTSWSNIVHDMKAMFVQYPRLAQIGKGIKGAVNSHAARGNALEAIHLCLDMYEGHHLDRDLNHMGQNIMLLTAGQGVFQCTAEVSKALEQRLVDQAVGLDVISVRQHPLHAAPMLMLTDADQQIRFQSSDWMYLSFPFSRNDSQVFVPSGHLYPTVRADELMVLNPCSHFLAKTPQDFSAHDREMFKPRSRALSGDEHPAMVKLSGEPGSPLAPLFSSRTRSGTHLGQSWDRARSSSVTKARSFDGQQFQAGCLGPQFSVPNFNLTACNPFQLPSAQSHVQKTATQRRWSHLFPLDASTMAATANAPSWYSSPNKPNWNSLVEPACLPVSTDMLPSAPDMVGTSLYHHNITESPLYKTTFEVAQELVRQRLLQNYQLYMRTSDSNKWVLVMGNRVHEIWYTPGTDEGVNVKMILPRDKVEKLPVHLQFKYSLWCPETEQFHVKSTQPVMNSSAYNWNQMDSIVAGYEDDVTDPELVKQLRYWRMRLAVMPAKSDDSMSKRVAAFKAFQNRLLEWGDNVEGNPQEQMRVRVIEVDDATTDSGEPLSELNVPPSRLAVKLDRKKTEGRFEWFVLKYDTVYHPATAYYLEIQWIMCTVPFVDEFLRHCHRQASKAGLLLVQLPTDQQHHANVSLRVPSIVDASGVDPVTVRALLLESGFLRDVGRDRLPGYLHHTGRTFVHERDNGTYLWIDNRLPATSAANVAAAFQSLKQFRSKCKQLRRQAAGAAEAVQEQIFNDEYYDYYINKMRGQDDD